MKNISSFNNYLILEKVQADLIKMLIKNKDKSAIDHLSNYTDLSKLTNDDIVKLDDPKVITKKPYTNSTNWSILVFGDKTEWIGGREDKSTGEYVKGHYLKIPNTLLYVIDGNNIYNINASFVSKKSERPSRKSIIDNKDYTFYAIHLNKKDATDWSDTDINKIKKARQINKSDSGLDFKNREDYYATIAQNNRNRYADQLKNIKDYSHLFDIIEKLILQVNNESVVFNKMMKYMSKDSQTESSHKQQLLRNSKRDMSVSSAYLKELNKFHHMFSYSSENKDGSKLQLLRNIGEELLNRLDPNKEADQKSISEVKALPEILKNFPLADLSEYEKYITSNSWRDSDELQKFNKGTGVLEE